MNIDNLVPSIDFDKLNSDCLVHSSLQAYIKKNPNLPSCFDSDYFELYLKNAVCFPSGCADCVGMNKLDIRKFVYNPEFIQRHNHVRISEVEYMSDLHE